MELWQMDIVGGVRLVDGSEAKIVSGIDDHSRFVICARVVARATGKPVCDALAWAMRTHGVPDEVLTDNGKVFTARFGPGPGPVLFDRICTENGIRHLLTAPRSPTTTGKVERWHKTLRREFLDGQVFASLDDAQAQLDAWVEHYNLQRPHQSLGGAVPWSRFQLARPSPAGTPAPPAEAGSAGPVTTRRVSSTGTISFATARYLAGRWLAGQPVEVVCDGGLVQLFHRGVLVATHACRHPVAKQTAGLERGRQISPARPSATSVSVTRKVVSWGNVCFAATNYHVGAKYRRRQGQVASSVTPSRTRSAESSSAAIPFATTAPANTAPSPTPAADPTGSTLREPPPPRYTATGARTSHGYRVLTRVTRLLTRLFVVASLEERFRAKVRRSGKHLLWTGATDAAGVGQVRVDGKLTTARRVAWELEHGSLPTTARLEGCPGSPACVRVEHLSIRGAPKRSPRKAAAPPGSGSKVEVRPGVWKLIVTVGRDDQGRLRRAYRTVHGSARTASKALAAFVTEVGTGDAIPTRKHRASTVTATVEAYLRHLEEDKGRKHSTLMRYRHLYATWLAPSLGARRAESVLPEHIDRALGAMRRGGQSASSIHQAFIVLNGAFKWARRNRRVTRNPMLDVEKPQSTKPAKEVIPPDVDQVLELIAAAFEDEHEFGVVCHLGAVTGMRRGELAGLQWKRVDLDQRSLLVEVTVNDAGGQVVIDDFTKTRRSRWVGFDEHTAVLLADLRRQAEERAATCETELMTDAFVFSHSPDGSEPVRPEYLTRRMRVLRRTLGLELADFDTTLHALRHWTQTALNEAGFNPKQVAQRGGHTEQLMNKVYVHRTKGADEEMTKFVGGLLAQTPSRTRKT
jgi:integrase